MVETAIIYCNDGILIYRPYEEKKYQELKGSNFISLTWMTDDMEQAKRDIELLKE